MYMYHYTCTLLSTVVKERSVTAHNILALRRFSGEESLKAMCSYIFPNEGWIPFKLFTK